MLPLLGLLDCHVCKPLFYNFFPYKSAGAYTRTTHKQWPFSKFESEKREGAYTRENTVKGHLLMLVSG